MRFVVNRTIIIIWHASPQRWLLLFNQTIYRLLTEQCKNFQIVITMERNYVNPLVKDRQFKFTDMDDES